MAENMGMDALGLYLPGQDFLSLPANHVKRDGLISMLLQDRGALRLISAPHGFGKTELAREYAVRLFSGKSVVWIDGDSPDFLLSLDSDGHDDPFQLKSKPSLIIVDNLPWLHEQRAQALSHRIDKALYSGSEVMVTTLPSCDCLSALQPDRLSMHATDMLICDQECSPRCDVSAEEDGRAFGMRRWREAGKRLFGHTPMILWNTESKGQFECLSGLFSESIPPSLLRCMTAMLLLGNGNFDDLGRIDVRPRPDDVSMLVRDYPIFGIDSVSGTFCVAQFRFEDLRGAIVGNKLESLLLDGMLSLPERVLGILFGRGDTHRGSRIINTFCSDERCAGWLQERGWDFLDQGEIDVVSRLLERCPEQAYAQSPDIQVVHAWHAGFSGDRRGACHLARRVLEMPTDESVSNAAGVAARIALAAFDDDAILGFGECNLSTPGSPQDAADFLAAVLDLCTDVEIARAFRPDSDSLDQRFEKYRRPPGRRRSRLLAALFTDHAQRFSGTREFRISLHLLSFVDAVHLHSLVQELGCDVIVEARRGDVTDFSTALLVRDMWQMGYFGLIGPVMDRKDAKVLDGASSMLGMLAHYCGSDSAFLPWEVKGASFATNLAKSEKPIAIASGQDMYVRLFGGFEVVMSDRYIGESRWRKKARALIAILVLSQGRDVTREEVFAQLWPGASHVHALDNFYSVWGNCMSVLENAPYIEKNGEFCRVDPRFVHSDVSEFEQLTRHLLTANHDTNHLLDTYAKIEALYRGALMPSETGVKLINVQRERFHALYVDAMVAASECALEVGDVRVSLWFARKAFDEDQEREDVYQVLMKAQMMAGQRCSAIRTYLGCRDYLRSALGLDPSLETRELYNMLVTTDPELLRLDSSSFLNIQ